MQNIDSALRAIRLNNALVLIGKKRACLIHRENELFGMIQLAQGLGLTELAETLTAQRLEIAQKIMATSALNDFDPKDLPF